MTDVRPRPDRRVDIADKWQGQYHAICQRLTARFEGAADRTNVEALVARLFASFGDARILNYVPILVERAAAEELLRADRAHDGERHDR